MLKFAITTLGCKVNQCEEKQISSLFINAGFGQVGLKDAAAVYIINSCAITREAENKARQIASSLKGRFPDCLIALAGCYTTRLNGEKIKHIDLYIQQCDKDKILDICLCSLEEKGFNPICRPDASSGGAHHAAGPHCGFSSRTRAQLKIQDGCKSFCSYCIVPYIRNIEYSMPPEDVIGEIDRLSKDGYSEIVLTGIHIGKYSTRDIYSRPFGLEQLLKMIDLYPFAREFRIRLSSIDPAELSESMILLIKNSPRFVPHFHVALQSGSDRILKLMKRAYGRAEFIEKIELIKKYIELPALTSDVIVGFPSETPEDFNDTYKLLDELEFYDFHIFQYSDRPGTQAYSMKDKVEATEKKRRSAELHELKYKKNRMFYDGNAGREAFVIAEKIISTTSGGQAVLSGHTERYIEAVFEGLPDMIAKIVRIKLIAPSASNDGMTAVLI
jgi:threonylcarbamoyladenosine tRNA methylthiotransferase MtaB